MSKASILRITAQAIREGAVYYRWEQQESCNCGVLAQTILGKSAAQLKREIKPLVEAAKEIVNCERGATWSDMTKALCPATGLPESAIFLALHEAGFTPSELRALEFLSDPAICAAAKINTAKTRSESFVSGRLWWKKVETREVKAKEHCAIAANVSAYMEAWADMLDSQSEAVDALQSEAERIKSEVSGEIAASNR